MPVPVLDPRHDLAHPVEGDGAWSESYYFNAYDTESDSGFFTRIGIRPNEGTMDAAMSVWLPGGALAEHREAKPQHEMVDTVLAVGSIRYEMIEPLRAWRLTMDTEAAARSCVADTEAAARSCVAGAEAAARARVTDTEVADRAGVPPGGASRPVRVALDVRFDALTPGIGTDGQVRRAAASAEAVAAAASVGKGHLEQAGRWTGWLSVDGKRHRWDGALGNRDRSWGPRRWGGPKMWRWFSVNVGPSLHLGGIRLGTEAGELHRGWVWADGRAASIAEWRLRTELADDGITHRVVHLDAMDKAGRRHRLRGDVLRVADIGQVTGTLVNEGLTRWTYLDGQGEPPVGSGISEYLHQLDGDGNPLVPVE